MPEDVVERISDEEHERAMVRCEADLERDVGSCTREEYREYLRAKVERGRADIAAGRTVSNEEASRRAAVRRKELLRRLAAQR